MPAVTVIMPVYQGARTIARAVKSIRRQTFRDWELIVVDDGSSDDSAAVATWAAEGDARVCIHRLPENRGAAAAMNVAWRASDSSLVAIMDSDDVALPPRLERQVAALDRERSVSVLGAAAHCVAEDGTLLRTVCLPLEHEALAEGRWHRSPFVHPTVLMRRDFLETLGGYQDGYRLGEDSDLWMRGFAHGGFRYGNLPEPLLLYCARPVQRWAMVWAGAKVRWHAGRREARVLCGATAAARILGEGVIEQTGIFAWRERRTAAPAGLNMWQEWEAGS